MPVSGVKQILLPWPCSHFPVGMDSSTTRVISFTSPAFRFYLCPAGTVHGPIPSAVSPWVIRRGNYSVHYWMGPISHSQEAEYSTPPASDSPVWLAANYEFVYSFQTRAESKDPRDQTLSVVLLGEADLRSADAVSAGKPGSSLLHSGFLQLGMNGRIAGTLDYMVNGIFQAGVNCISDDSRTLLLIGGLAEGSLSWSPGGSLSSVIIAEAL